MKKVLLAGAALAALVSSASAADLGGRVPYAKAPAAPVSPATNWSGFYIGAMGGYGRLSADDADLSGGFAGGTIGYNWQAPGSQFVWGVEVDAAASSIKLSEDGFVDLKPFRPDEKVRLDEKAGAFGSVTGRVGYAVDAALFYLKGGYAAVHNKQTFTSLSRGVSVSESHIHSGATVGGGLEYMLAPGWSAKAEYMFAAYGRETYFDNQDIGPFHIHTIKGGINYHFN